MIPYYQQWNAQDIIREDSARLAGLFTIVKRARERETVEETAEARTATRKALHDYNEFYTPLEELFTDESAEEFRKGVPEAIEWAVSYLEIDPFYFRSGYKKSWLMRQLKQAPLSSEMQERLQKVVLRMLDESKRAFKDYMRLGSRIQSSDFNAQVNQRLQSSDAIICMRAQLFLDYLNHYNRSHTSDKTV